jgi:serine/threonine-protein kinase
MELCPGRPLSEIIEENPHGLPEQRVLPLLIDLARALDAAHAKGVVHRDVKPENILVDEDNGWSMKITDFGIARSQDQARLTKSGLVMGTAQYLSPEQAMGKQATSLSDIYSLGIVAYEMLEGHRPFTGSTQVEIAMAQVKKQPPPLREEINPDLRQLVMMSLAKAPANRPRSAAAVARILESISRGEEPRFTTGAVPTLSTSSASGRSPASRHLRSGGSAPSASSASSASRRSAGSPGTGPTRTAAMPLPPAVRSAPSPAGPGTWSVASGGSPSRPAPPAASASRSSDPPPPEDPHLPTSSGRTQRKGTGTRIGPFSLPGIVLIVILLLVVAAAIAGAMGLLGPVPWNPERAEDAAAHTMVGMVRTGLMTRTVGL